MTNKTEKWHEEWTDNASNQANTKEKAVIYYGKRKNKNVIDRVVNYCSDKNFKVIETYNTASCSKNDSKKLLFNMLSLINAQNDRIHVVCYYFYEIFYDDEVLQILEPLIIAGKITIHILKQNFIIDKNSYNAEMINLINNMLFVTNYRNTLSYQIRVAKNYKKNIGKSKKLLLLL